MKLRNQNRRGVTLIFVISLIVLFVLLGTTFAVVTANYLKSAKQSARREIYRDPPKRTLDRVLKTLIHDTTNADSAFNMHSLGADMYGFDGFRGTVSNVLTVAKAGPPVPVGGVLSDFLALEIRPVPVANPLGLSYPTIADNTPPPSTDALPDRPRLYFQSAALDNSNFYPSEYAGAYNGQVLTFTNGSAKGVSCRIVGYSYEPGALDTTANDDIVTFYIKLDQGSNSNSAFSTATLAYPQGLAQRDFVVNGRPFNGKGAGWVGDMAAGTSELIAPGMPSEALRPNRAVRNAAGILPIEYWRGGLDEDYDAADYNNMFLSAVLPLTTIGTATDVWNDIYIIPSFHRPALIQHARLLGIPDNEIILRPIPGTPGVSTDFPALADDLLGPWDVDNDGDGIPDSIWIDPGYPVQTDASGRRYKVLTAVHIQDMGGRLNINATGSPWQSFTQITPPQIGYSQASGPDPAEATGNPIFLANGFSTRTLANRGVGYGPGEISLRTVFRATTDQPTEYQNLLFGDANKGLLGRFGYDNGSPLPGPGAIGLDLVLNAKLSGYPITMMGGSFGSYSDIHGRFAVGISLDGIPRYDRTTLGLEPANSMYQVNLTEKANGMSGRNASDQTYSFPELERLLRNNDIDTYSLPKRLTENSNTLTDVRTSSAPSDPGSRLDRAFRARRSITTHSFDVPALPNDVLAMLRSRLEGNIPLNDPYFIATRQDRQPNLFTIRQFIAEQSSWMLNSKSLGMNLPMDLNQPFGNGQDDNANGVIDEHAIFDPAFGAQRADIDESFIPEPIWNGAIFDGDNDGDVGNADADAFLVRYHYARNLFVLTLLNMPQTPGGGGVWPSIDFDGNGDPTTDTLGNASTFETEKAVAQWVANVVDFRDTDSIMSVLEFDLNPFDGWHADGLVATTQFQVGSGMGAVNVNETNRFVVVGTERPELLISETFAAHDRRTEDLNTDNFVKPGMGMGMGMGHDEDFDQRLKPMGTFMLELVNPWADSTLSPNELYRNNGGVYGVDLRTTSQVGGSPVWRVLIVRTENAGDNPAGMDKDPDHPYAWPGNHPTPNNFALDPNEVERSIYFVPPTGALPPPAQNPNHGEAFVLSQETWNLMRPIGHKQFAVIGSAGHKVDDGAHDKYVLPMGRLNDPMLDETTDLMLDKTRRFNMVVGQSIQLHEAGAGGVIVSGPVNPCMAVPIDIHHSSGSTRSFSISEPANGYPAATATTFVTANPFGGGGNVDVIDYEYAAPRDEPLDDNRTDLVSSTLLKRKGTLDRFREVHLQRLANPLAPWHPIVNPYRTIDSMSVDLTVFSAGGTTQRAPRDRGEDFRALNLLTLGNVKFGGKQRGDQFTSQGNPQLTAIPWLHEPPTAMNTTPQPRGGGNVGSVANDGHLFSFHIEIPEAAAPFVEQESFGYINWEYNLDYEPNNPAVPNATTHPVNPKYGAIDTQPLVALPWLNWNNRLFVSQYELMQVPKSWSSTLLKDYSIHNPMAQEYNPAPNQPARFGHLMPFFKTDVGGTAPELHRIFHYTRVPSRFVGTEEWLTAHINAGNPPLANDLVFQGMNPGTDNLIFNAPFNRISRYREPGKINLNTVYQRRVWDGLFGRIPNPNNPYPISVASADWLTGHIGPEWSTDIPAFGIDLISSRRGYGAALVGLSMATADATIPTFFSKPFRTADTGNLVPAAGMVKPDVEHTLLRGNDMANVNTRTPLFERPLVDAATEIHQNANRNPYFRYESLQRLGNLTTTKSNVYAVWITIGYFEIDPQTGDLGKEVGSDFGEVKRHRMFSVVDRSIPFGFEPGQDNNVDKVIMLKRYIE